MASTTSSPLPTSIHHHHHHHHNNNNNNNNHSNNTHHWNAYRVLFGLVIALTVWVCDTKGQPYDNSRGDPHQCYCLQELMPDLYSPTGAHFIVGDGGAGGGGGQDTVLVVEQRGTVRAVSLTTGDRVKKSEMFMDIRDRVYVTNDVGDSRGLLSAVLSPNFHADGKVYVYYIRKVEGKVYAMVSRFHAKDGRVDTSAERFLLKIYQPYSHGNGGPMLFGDDGYLYIVVGDGGAHDDSLGNAQNKNSFHGSVLRIDPQHSQAFTGGESGIAKMYGIPGDNPFVNDTSAKAEVFAFGFRNPWGCSVDSKTLGGDGRIYCAETGTDQFDEINILEKGKNYAWNLKEGRTCLNATGCGNIENEAFPILEFQHISHHALVGGFVYRGKELVWMKDKGFYTFADIVTGETYYLSENRTLQLWDVHEWSLCEVDKCPTDARDKPLPHLYGFAQDKKGEIYFLMVNAMKAKSPEGKMYKVRGAGRSSSLCLAPNLWSVVVASLVIVVFSQKE